MAAKGAKSKTKQGRNKKAGDQQAEAKKATPQPKSASRKSAGRQAQKRKASKAGKPEAGGAANKRQRTEEAPDRNTKAHRLEEAQAAKPTEDEDAEPRGVIYVGHVPQGFFEPQMMTFFEQFGKVTRLRLSRSKKTGGIKGYGWVEFEQYSVAKIVAETMDKYLVAGKVLVCKLVPADQVHPRLFRRWRDRMFRSSNTPKRRLAKFRKRHSDRPTVEVDGEELPQKTKGQVQRRTASVKKLEKRLKQLDVDFDLGEVEGLSRPPPRPKLPKVASEAQPEPAATKAASVPKHAAPAAEDSAKAKGRAKRKAGAAS